MIDLSFFDKKCDGLSLQDLCDATDAVVVSKDVAIDNISIKNVAPLISAEAGDVSFFENKKYLDQFKSSQASACFVSEKMVALAPKDMICLVSKSPYTSYAKAAQMFYGLWPEYSGTISERASIANDVILGKNVTIEDGVVLKSGVQIGDGTSIGANTVIEKAVKIGAHCKIAPLVSLTHCHIGDRVSIATGARIGQPGFGFAMSAAGFTSVPQLGRVILEDDVDIGANTCIDRGTLNDTTIGQGTRIDNLVQIGHNVKAGKLCVVVSQVGISGSTELEDYVVLGGQVGIAGHLKLSSGVRIAAQSGVTRDVKTPGEYMGTPVQPITSFMRQVATLRKMIAKKK